MLTSSKRLRIGVHQIHCIFQPVSLQRVCSQRGSGTFLKKFENFVLSKSKREHVQSQLSQSVLIEHVHYQLLMRSKSLPPRRKIVAGPQILQVMMALLFLSLRKAKSVVPVRKKAIIVEHVPVSNEKLLPHELLIPTYSVLFIFYILLSSSACV